MQAANADFDVTQGHFHIFTPEAAQKRIAAENLKLSVWPYINYGTFCACEQIPPLAPLIGLESFRLSNGSAVPKA